MFLFNINKLYNNNNKKVINAGNLKIKHIVRINLNFAQYLTHLLGNVFAVLTGLIPALLLRNLLTILAGLIPTLLLRDLK